MELHKSNGFCWCSPLRRITFHGFPENLEVLEKWRTAIKLESSFFMENFHLAICSEHFKQSDFEKGDSEQVLKPDVIPSLRLPPSYEENKLRPVRPKVYSNKFRFQRRDTNIGLQNSVAGEKLNWIQESSSSSDSSKRICHGTSERQDRNYTRHFIILPGQMKFINQPNPLHTQVCIPPAVKFSDPMSHNYTQVYMDSAVVLSEQEQPSTNSCNYRKAYVDTYDVFSEQEQHEQPSTNSCNYRKAYVDTYDVFSEQEQPEQPSTNSHNHTQIYMETHDVFSEQEQPEQPSTPIKEETICPETDKNCNSPNPINISGESEFLATQIKVEPEEVAYKTSNKNSEQPPIIIKSENLLCFGTLEKDSCSVETICVPDETEEDDFLETKIEIEDGPLEINESESGVEGTVDIKDESEILKVGIMDLNQMDPKTETDKRLQDECVKVRAVDKHLLLP